LEFGAGIAISFASHKYPIVSFTTTPVPRSLHPPRTCLYALFLSTDKLTVSEWGGAISITGDGAQMAVRGSTFMHNTANGGSAIWAEWSGTEA
jgi:hypothetical protein